MLNFSQKMRREERRSEALIFPGLDGLLVTIDIKLGYRAKRRNEKSIFKSKPWS